VVEAQDNKQEMVSKAEEQFMQMCEIEPSDTSYVDECLHLPNEIDFMTEIHTGDKIIREYNCHSCGKIIQNIYKYTETRETVIKL
jgi:hypothetical protein